MNVTVLLTVYNGAPYLSEAIDSILRQTHTRWTLIVINDGSTDASLQIATGYTQLDQRIQVYSQENQGMAASLNRGLLLANTDWVFRMDADDVMHPNRLERQLFFLAQHPDVLVSSCRAEYINTEGRTIGVSSNELWDRSQFEYYLAHREAIGLLHPGVVMHRPTVLSVGGYRDQFWPADDIDLWNRLAEQGHLILVQDEVLMQYRIHGASISTAKTQAARMKYEWVRTCMTARRSGQPEPTWDEFLGQWRQAPFLTQLNRYRKNQAKYYYRTAAHDCINHHYICGGFKLAMAALLQPIYTLDRLKKQLLK